MSNFNKLKLYPKIKISGGTNQEGPEKVKEEFRNYGIDATYDLYNKKNTKITLSGGYGKSSNKSKRNYGSESRTSESQSKPRKYYEIKISKKFKKGGDVMPARNKKNFRSTKSGAGMTSAGVAAYRRANPGSKLKTAVTGKVKKGSKAANRRKSYCARSAGQMKKFPKAAADPNSRLRQARRRWKC
tara:strand:+ start:717 stop:1274 length:558 start_codon:yes stop_codon:yes gene_type:complete